MRVFDICALFALKVNITFIIQFIIEYDTLSPKSSKRLQEEKYSVAICLCISMKTDSSYLLC